MDELEEPGFKSLEEVRQNFALFCKTRGFHQAFEKEIIAKRARSKEKRQEDKPASNKDGFDTSFLGTEMQHSIISGTSTFSNLFAYR